MSLQKIISKTNEYLKVPSVVGHEKPFMDCLADDFNISGYDIRKEDRLLVVSKKGSKSSKIVTAHIDRHGIVVGDDGRFEYADFNARKIYGIENNHSEKFLEKCAKRFVDEVVYAYGVSGNILELGIVSNYSYNVATKDISFEIDGFGKLPKGTAVSYISSLTKENGNISSQIDNVISVAVANQLVQDGFDGALILATEEEIGRSWQHITNYLQSNNFSSQEIITLDTTPYNDERAISEGLIVLRNRDKNGEFNSDLVQNLRNICDSNEIKYEMKDEVLLAKHNNISKIGSTELGRIVQHTNGKLNGATVQLPTTNYHTNDETTSELSLNNYYQALKKLL